MRASNIFKGVTAITLAGLLASVAFAHELDKDRENLTVHDLSGFTEINVAGVYKIDVTVGEDFSVITSGSDKDVKYIKVEVDGDALVLGSKKKKKNWNIGKREGVYAQVTLPKLKSLEIAGIATGDVEGVDTKYFNVEVAGISDVTLSGTCGRFELDIAGMGEVDAEELKCKHVEANMAGMGEASVYASESVEASAAGMGQLNVYGKPETVDKNGSFMAKVNIK